MEVTANPKPGHLPIWIGGNSALTRRRVAAHGDGWNPFPASASLAATARTVPLEGLDALGPILDHLWEQVEAAGRDRARSTSPSPPVYPAPPTRDLTPPPTWKRSIAWPRWASPGRARPFPAPR